jgi:hypothetical protein
VDGRIQEAVVWPERSCQQRSQLDEDNSGRLSSYHSLAIAYQADGQVHKAVGLLEHVVEVQEKTLAAEHPSRVTTGAAARARTSIRSRWAGAQGGSTA